MNVQVTLLQLALLKRFSTRGIIGLEDIYEWCRSCEVCQTYGCKQLVPGPLNPIPAYGPFERWGLDFVSPLPLSHMESIMYWLLLIMQLDGQKQKRLSTTKQQ